MTDDPHQFTRDAWEANADVWDARMGDEGNDFFKMVRLPCFGKNIIYPHPAQYFEGSVENFDITAIVKCLVLFMLIPRFEY